MRHLLPSIARTLLLSTLYLAGLSTSFTATATEQEEQCIKEVQGKIPWDRDRQNMNWDPENVKHLCNGTKQPSQPGACYITINSDHAKGGVNWGKGVEWEWRNIINLCAGSNDAAKTVECFNNGVKTGTDWRDVILACRRIM